MAEIVMQEKAWLTEILAQLPVKSLIRFTSVCKGWLSLIRSPEFAIKQYATRLNLHLSRNQDDLCVWDSVLTQFIPGSSISILSHEDLTFATAFKFRPAVAYEAPKFGIHHRDIMLDWWLFGPCNGIFLIFLIRGGKEAVLLLWNPATREVSRIPPPNHTPGTFGFGFDHVTNDYKVVYFSLENKIVQLYSLVANSWKWLDTDIDTGGMRLWGGTVFHSACSGGMHHWILSGGCRDERKYALLSFDMVGEVFVKTPPVPAYATRSCYCNGFLYQGSNFFYPSLCFADKMETEEGSIGLHIWVFKGGNNWIEQQCIRLPSSAIRLPIMLWKNKAIVSCHGENIGLYDFTTQETKSLPLPADRTVIGYTESLVSIANISGGLQHQDNKSPADRSSSSAEICSGRLQHQDNQSPADRSSSAETCFEGLFHGGLQDQHNQSPADNSSSSAETCSRGLFHGGLQHQNNQSPADNSSSSAEIFSRGLFHGGLQRQDNQSVKTVPENDDEEEEEDDDGSSTDSTDSAFLDRGGTGFLDYNTVYIDYETDLKYFPHRKFEWQKLYNLPYCLCEVNRPMVSNPFTF